MDREPFRVVLEFPCRDDAENWIAGYLDGGGEQHLGYCVNLKKSKYKGKRAKEFTLIIDADEWDRCSDCRFPEMLSVEEYKERFKLMEEIDPNLYKVKDKNSTHKCQNCGHEDILKDPYA